MSRFKTGMAGPSLKTALIEAARKGEIAEVEALLGKGADVNAKTRDGHTALRNTVS